MPPFSISRTELVWPGKYDADGRRNLINPKKAIAAAQAEK